MGLTNYFYIVVLYYCTYLRNVKGIDGNDASGPRKVVPRDLCTAYLEMERSCLSP
jgi:hypothetical protein